MVKSETISLSTQGMTDIKDISDDLRDCVKKSKLKDGIVTVFVAGSTGGLTTIEYEPGLIKDMKEILEKMYPYKAHYEHHETWHDDNGSSHVRAAMIGPSITIPFINRELTLGTWQEVVFLDFDTSPRKRELVVQLVGE
jgi:secondary thiamine-phosphate synthase enzyme